MKILLVLTVILTMAIPAWSGDCGSSCKGGSCCGEDCACSLCGFDCENACPLAKQANRRRALGTDSLATSKALQKAAAAAVEKNLAKI